MHATDSSVSELETAELASNCKVGGSVNSVITPIKD